jgi:hypothetical protein
MTRLLRTLLVAAGLLSSASARGDVIADWNATALKLVKSEEVQPANALSVLADVHIAMFEAMNFIEGRYVSHLVVRPAAPIKVSSDAAAAAAAHYVLVQLYPGRSALLDAALERSLAQIPERDRKAGKFTGKAIGGNVYAIRASERVSATRATASFRSASDPLQWNVFAARLIESRPMAPFEAARLHALVSLAVSELYSAQDQGSFAEYGPALCVSCAAGVATSAVLESGQGPLRLRRRWGGYAERSLGEKFAAQALAYYRPADGENPETAAVVVPAKEPRPRVLQSRAGTLEKQTASR